MNNENPPYSIISIRKSFIVLILFAFSSIFIGKFAFQWAPEALDPSQNTFSAKRAFKHWSRLSVSVPNRHMSTLNYNKSYDYVYSEIKRYKEIADQSDILKISIEEQRGEIYESKIARLIQLERDARNIIVLVELNKKQKLQKSPIMVSAHIDGKNRGPAAYDDAAGIAAMLELLNLLVESKKPPSRPIILLFVGVEELGLQGSKLFLKYHNCSNAQLNSTGCFFDTTNDSINIASRFIENSSSFLNIESLGPGMPLGIMQKGKGSAGTINSLKNTKGLIFGTFADDVTKLGLITSTSDAVRFREKGMAGAELLFFGNPTKYHTQLDSISTNSNINDETNNYKTTFSIDNFLNYETNPINHLQLLGNALTDFVFKYTIIENTDNQPPNRGNDNFNPKSVMAAIGISPFALVMEIKFAKMCGLTISLMTLYVIYSSNNNPIAQILLAFLFEILSWLIMTLILLIFGIFHFFINSLAYARSPIFSFNYLLFCGLFIYTYFLHLFTSPKSPKSIRNISPLIYQRSLTLFNCILVLSLTYLELDSSIMFVWQLFFTNLANLFNVFCPTAAFLANIAGFAYINFSVFLLFTFMTRYTSMIPGVVGEIVPFVVTSMSILFVAFSFTPFIVKTANKEQKNINKKEIKKQSKENKKNLNENENDDKNNEEKQKNKNKDNENNDDDNNDNKINANKNENNDNNENKNKNNDKKKLNLSNENDNNENKNKGHGVKLMFIVSIVLLILPFFAPPPYNRDSYNIQGDIAHIIDPQNGSYVSFAPIQQKRVFIGVRRFINKNIDNPIMTRFRFEMPLAKYDVFYRNATDELPPFIKKWPFFTISIVNKSDEKNERQNLRNVVVSVPEENQDLIAINLVVDCGSSPCIDKVNYIGNINETESDRNWNSWVINKEDLQVTNMELKDKFGYRHDLRVMPGFQPASFDFDVFGNDPIKMKVTFTWDTLTDEAKAFLADLPDFIQPFGRMRSIVDTSLVNYTYI